MSSIYSRLKRFLSNYYLITLTKFRKHTYLKLGKDAYLPWNSEILTAVEIGEGTGINGKIRIIGGSKVTIGKFCALGSDIKIISSNHDISKANMQAKFAMENFQQSLDVTKGEIIIGHNVWIGDSAVILSGVHIGHGAVIGAGSIVTKSVPPFAVVAGNPARLIKMRFDKKIIEQLMDIQWWNWPKNKIKLNRDFFKLDLTTNPKIRLKSIIVN